MKKVGPRALPVSPFVGRDTELDLFRRLRQAAAAGRGAVIAISGDHGVGKTRLAREILADTERAGYVVLWGQGYDDEGSPAYWPWAELIKRYADRFGLERARKVMGTGVRDIAGLIPALESLAPAAGGSREPPSQQARYRLFAAMRSFVQRAAADSPLLLVLDDLHYCDPDTLRLFEAVAGDLEHGRVLLIGTYVQRRALHHHALPSVLAAISKLPWWHEVTVGNLSEQEVRLLLESEVGKKGAAALAPSVHRQTEGNALLVVEAVRQIAMHAAAGDRHLADDGWEDGTSGSVAILISRRLTRLSQPAIFALQTAAVIGRDVDLDLLAATMRATPAETRDLLAGPLEEGLLVEIAADRCRFAHELVQRAVAANLAPTARCAIHRSAGEALEAFRAAGRPADPERMAWHFASAGTEHAVKAGRYAREAGERAIETAAYDTALRHLEAAAAVAGLPQRERAELAMLRAWTLFALTRFFEVVQYLAEAFDLYAASGDVDRAADAAAFDTFPQGAESLPRDELRRLRERALAVAAPDSPQEARLLCALGETCSYTQPDRAEACLSRAMALARSLGDRHLEARVLYAQAWMEYRQLKCPAFLHTGAEALRLAREIGDRGLELLAGGRLANWMLFCGDATGTEQLARELRAATTLRSSLWTLELQRAERRVALYRGRWTDYKRYLAEDRWIKEAGIVVGVLRDSVPPIDYRTLKDVLADFDQRPQYYINPDRFAMRVAETARAARNLGDTSRLADVEALARRALSLELSPLGRLHALVALGFVAVLRSDLTLLSEVCGPELVAAPEEFLVEYSEYVLDGVRGLFFGLLDRDREAREYFERGLEFGRRCELIWEHYATCIYYAAFLLRRGERRRASELAEEARSDGGGLGMKGLDRQLAELTSRLEGTLPDGLTQREVEVVALAARGLPTKQIAGELDISYYTVVNHLHHIYAKTGARCRVDLAAYALRHHLGPSDA